MLRIQIVHGISNANRRAIIKVSLHQDNDFLTIIIEDNGIGLQKSFEIKSRKRIKEPGFGIRLSHERLELLNRIYRSNLSFSIEEMYDSKDKSIGTKVRICVPIED